MTNPFEDENGVYHVLINDEGQHSLWPSFIQVPEGWTIIHQSASRAACLEFINQHWTDMRPNSLIEHMKELSGTAQPSGPASSDATRIEGQRSALGSQDKTLTEEYSQEVNAFRDPFACGTGRPAECAYSACPRLAACWTT